MTTKEQQMPPEPSDPAQIDDLDQKIRDNLQRMVPGTITRFSRQARWRPAWDVDMIIDGEPRRIHVRAEKGKNYVGPMDLHQEAKVHDILESHGIPVPHVYGMMDDPIAIVMDLIPGQINLTTAASDSARDAIRTQYVEALEALHRIPLAEFGAIGLPVPETSEAIALNLYQPCEQIYRQRMAGRPFALMEFIWRWVTRNVPKHRQRAAFITADSGQFLFQDDRLTGLIDFEVGYVGDPLAEFAGMRLRDSTEPLGDINTLMDHYEQLTGDILDKNTVEYHTAGFCAVNGFLLWPLAFDPDINDDYVAYLSFSVGTSRWAINAIAEILGLGLGDITPPDASPLMYSAAPRHLLNSLPRLGGSGEMADYEMGKADSLARYVERANLYGRAIHDANLDAASTLLGKPFAEAEHAEQALMDFVNAAGPEHDAALVDYFHHWLLRQDFLLRGCGTSSWGTGLMLQKIRERNTR
jgi:aminoglycoside phosphotransferase (APT) family kinase protein